jgi:hypothetical protein
MKVYQIYAEGDGGGFRKEYHSTTLFVSREEAEKRFQAFREKTAKFLEDGTIRVWAEELEVIPPPGMDFAMIPHQE